MGLNAMNLSPQQLKAANLARSVEDSSPAFLAMMSGQRDDILRAATVTDCIAQGYAPKAYNVADFTIIRVGKTFHLFHIPRVPGHSAIHLGHEHWLAHATSTDLDTWIARDPVLCVDSSIPFEAGHLWAPFVFENDGVYYMYYTGLSSEPSQVLCLATSTDPELNIWHRYEGNPLYPFEGLDWHWKNQQGHGRHGRDPHVVRVGDHFLLAYTTMHANGCPAVGGFISTDLKQWDDIGPILYRPSAAGGWMPESVNIQPLADGQWALIPSMTPGLEVYLSPDPHSWHDAKRLPISYSRPDGYDPMGPEVLLRNDAQGEWLVAFFENERLFIGVLDIKTWTLRKLTSRAEVEPWLSR